MFHFIMRWKLENETAVQRIDKVSKINRLNRFGSVLGRRSSISRLGSLVTCTWNGGWLQYGWRPRNFVLAAPLMKRHFSTQMLIAFMGTHID